MPEPIIQWKRVSIDDVDIYLPWDAPVEVTSRTLTFGEVESGDTAIAPSVEGERACDSNGDPSSDGDGTMSGSSIDSNRVNAALLAEKSQHMSQTRRIRDGDSPVSSKPPIQHADHPNGLVRWRR